jgi:hypothetical protein
MRRQAIPPQVRLAFAASVPYGNGNRLWPDDWAASLSALPGARSLLTNIDEPMGLAHHVHTPAKGTSR